MHEITLGSVPLRQLAAILPPERRTRLASASARATQAFGDRVVWHVSATGRGGGVAEMLRPMLAYGRGAGIDTRWVVLDGDAQFFAITKRLHNFLHGHPGDAGPLGEAERAHYRAVLDANLAAWLPQVTQGDLVLLHDPQTAGLAEALRRRGVHVAWRCHVGLDRPSELSDTAWRFLRDDLVAAEALIFSRAEYAPAWVDPARFFVITPSVDPLSAKNRALSPATVMAVLATTGLVTGVDPAGATFVRADGTVGAVRSPGRPLVLDGPPPPHDAPLVVQVSRWDRLKDMPGVMAAFGLLLERPGTELMHLVLAGPATTGVGDDPEGAGVLDECRAAWHDLPRVVRERTHLVEIPVDDVEENAIVVNALQRHAFAVVQKSLEEGFGLTVTEAMWKGKPVVASRVGGIQDQILHGRDGLLLDDPRDLRSCAAALGRLVDEPGLAERLGAAARTRVLDDFLIDRHLEAYVELLGHLVAAVVAPGVPAAAPRPGT